MTIARLDLTREQILAFRRRAGGLDERLPPGPDSLRRAAWCGLQDSMPRAALLSIHARVARAGPSAWEDPSLVQLWGPRFSVFVVAARDLAVFSLGLLPDDVKGREKAADLAARLHTALGGRRVPHEEAGVAVGVPANRLRYAAATGTVLIRWEGARQPAVWTVPPPEGDDRAARLELARRYLHSYGPATPEGFARWSGIGPRYCAAAFQALGDSLAPASTPVGDAWLLAEDEAAVRAVPGPAARRGCCRAVTPTSSCRAATATCSSPTPAAAMRCGPRGSGRVPFSSGERSAGRGRRAGAVVTAQPWRPLTPTERDAVTAEAESLPLPALNRRVTVHWDE